MLTYLLVCSAFATLIPLRGLLIASSRQSLQAAYALDLIAILLCTKIILSLTISGGSIYDLQKTDGYRFRYPSVLYTDNSAYLPNPIWSINALV